MVMLNNEKTLMKLYTDRWKKKIETLEMRAEPSEKKKFYFYFKQQPLVSDERLIEISTDTKAVPISIIYVLAAVLSCSPLGSRFSGFT